MKRVRPTAAGDGSISEKTVKRSGARQDSPISLSGSEGEPVTHMETLETSKYAPARRARASATPGIAPAIDAQAMEPPALGENIPPSANVQEQPLVGEVFGLESLTSKAINQDVVARFSSLNHALHIGKIVSYNTALKTYGVKFSNPVDPAAQTTEHFAFEEMWKLLPLAAAPLGKSGKDLEYCSSDAVSVKNGDFVLARKNGLNYVPAQVTEIPPFQIRQAAQARHGKYDVRLLGDVATARSRRNKLYLMFSDSPMMLDEWKQVVYPKKRTTNKAYQTTAEKKAAKAAEDNTPLGLLRNQMSAAQTLQNLPTSNANTRWLSIKSDGFKKLRSGIEATAMVTAVHQTGITPIAGVLSVLQTSSNQLVLWTAASGINAANLTPASTANESHRYAMLLASTERVRYGTNAQGQTVWFKFEMKDSTIEEFAMPTSAVAYAIAYGTAMESKLSAAARGSKKAARSRNSAAATAPAPDMTIVPRNVVPPNGSAPVIMHGFSYQQAAGLVDPNGVSVSYPRCTRCTDPLEPESVEELTTGRCQPRCANARYWSEENGVE